VNSSGGWTRTSDLRVMSEKPESVPFIRRVLQISQTGERWLRLARHAAIGDRCSYSILFAWVRQVPFYVFIRHSFQFNYYKSFFKWGNDHHKSPTTNCVSDIRFPIRGRSTISSSPHKLNRNSILLPVYIRAYLRHIFMSFGELLEIAGLGRSRHPAGFQIQRDNAG